jgi:putative hydrolase
LVGKYVLPRWFEEDFGEDSPFDEEILEKIQEEMDAQRDAKRRGKVRLVNLNLSKFVEVDASEFEEYRDLFEGHRHADNEVKDLRDLQKDGIDFNLGSNLRQNLNDFTEIAGSLVELIQNSSSEALQGEIAKLAKAQLADEPRIRPVPRVNLSSFLDEVRELVAEFTDMVDPDLPVKPVSSTEWVDDSVAFWVEMSEPVYDTLSNQIQEFGNGSVSLTPYLGIKVHEFSSVFHHDDGGASPALGRAMYAFRMGESLANITRNLISGSDMGVPSNMDVCEILVDTASRKFANTGITFRKALPFLVTRELLMVSLYRRNPWIKVQIKAMIYNYTKNFISTLQIAQKQIQSMMDSGSINSAEELQVGLEEVLNDEGVRGIADLTNAETHDIVRRFGLLLCLVDDWATHTAFRILQPSRFQDSLEHMIRFMHSRHHEYNVTEASISVLLGHSVDELKFVNTFDFWHQAYTKLGTEGVEKLWNHPDNLPTLVEMDDFDNFMKSFDGGTRRPLTESNWDRELKKLFDSDNE